ncbi:MAG: NAD-dependent epimerase/dehydratase family protein [Pirellulaceae bacterium]
MHDILVTGASGFIGGHLVRELVERGTHVRCLLRPTSNAADLDDLDIDRVSGDVLHASSIVDALDGIDTVIHLAGLTRGVDVGKLEEINCQGSHNVAAACSAMNEAPTLICVSSLAAVGPASRGGVLLESAIPRPVSAYGRSKLLGELAVRRHANRVPTTIVRPAIVFGERDLALLELMKTIKTFRVIPVIGSRAPQTSMIHVHDLVQLLCSTIERGRRVTTDPKNQEGIYFASTDELLTLKELGQQLAKLIRPGRLTLTVPIPVFAARVVAVCSEFIAARQGVPALFNRDKVREAIAPSWACSNGAAKRELGFEPNDTLVEQLRHTVNWYRDHQWL